MKEIFLVGNFEDIMSRIGFYNGCDQGLSSGLTNKVKAHLKRTHLIQKMKKTKCQGDLSRPPKYAPRMNKF